MNRLTAKTYPNASAVNYTYDNDSRLTQVTDPTGTYEFTFDNMGRLTSATTNYAFLLGRSFTTSYGYDAASNRTSLADPEGGSTSYAYDTLNQLTTLTPPPAISGGSFGFSYDALSRRTQMTRPNGVSTSYQYDSLSRLLSVLHQLGGATIDGASYSVDAAGNRTSKTDQRAVVSSNYTYDAIYQLTQVVQGANTTENYSYDPVGNRLSSLGVSPYNYNVSNQLTVKPGVAYTYDNNGNTQSKADSTGTTNYTWDFENRLSSVTLPGTGGTVSFKYDPFGRRIYKASSSGASIFAYDGNNLVEETNSSGAAVARYTQTNNTDEPLAMLRSATTSYYEADGIGSVTSLSSAAGALVQTYTYDSFGNVTASSGSLTNPFQYTARESDTETGLYYYRARYYDPSTGRFITEDPIRFTGGFDFYGYVGNSPIDVADPLGLFGIRDGITRHQAVDIDPSCGTRSGGACTLFRAALVLCTCTKDGCDDKWKANAELRIYGDMYIYSGPFPYKGRKPKDPSVHDAASAIAHEYNRHINPATAAVTPLINALEAKTFKSKEECQGECDKTSGVVNKLFRQTLRQTQVAENNQ